MAHIGQELAFGDAGCLGFQRQVIGQLRALFEIEVEFSEFRLRLLALGNIADRGNNDLTAFKMHKMVSDFNRNPGSVFVDMDAFPHSISIAVKPFHRQRNVRYCLWRINVDGTHCKKLVSGISEPLTGRIIHIYKTSGNSVHRAFMHENSIVDTVKKNPQPLFAIL